MQSLHSPWRFQYVSGGSAPPEGPGGCVFCAAALAGVSPESLVVHSDPAAFVLLNRYPYNNGHLLVVPRPHVDSLTGLPPEAVTRCAELLVLCERVLRQAYGCHGLNMGLNLGEAAGAGIADHIHWHALPRWRGDTNFMTALAETRVVPEDLGSVHRRLQPLFASLVTP
jgi:ATP adenylyltransferase